MAALMDAAGTRRSASAQLLQRAEPAFPAQCCAAAALHTAELRPCVAHTQTPGGLLMLLTALLVMLVAAGAGAFKLTACGGCSMGAAGTAAGAVDDIDGAGAGKGDAGCSHRSRLDAFAASAWAWLCCKADMHSTNTRAEHTRAVTIFQVIRLASARGNGTDWGPCVPVPAPPCDGNSTVTQGESKGMKSCTCIWTQLM